MKRFIEQIITSEQFIYKKNRHSLFPYLNKLIQNLIRKIIECTIKILFSQSRIATKLIHINTNEINKF